jgi:formamidopyrimidine-DNA glycosylase
LTCAAADATTHIVPELPEVETVARSLRPLLAGRTFGAVWTSGLALRTPVDRARLARVAGGARVESVERRGKYLLLHLSRGHALLCHLGMTGRLLVESASVVRPAHTHVAIALDAGDEELRYVDARRFGYLAALRHAELARAPELAVLGVDPLTPEFTDGYLDGALGASRRAVKDFLMDQGRVAGLGNIYAAEALFVAGISPRRRADRLGPRRAALLAAAIRGVLGAAVERRGTSFSDYVDAEGRSGDNQHHLGVYGREGQPCRRCERPIRRLVQGARSTFYCPGCQR